MVAMALIMLPMPLYLAPPSLTSRPFSRQPSVIMLAERMGQ